MKLTHTVSNRIGHLFVAVSVGALCLGAAAPDAQAQSKSGFTYNGMDYISYSSNEYLETPQGLEGTANLRATGANYTAVMATWYVQTYDSTGIAPDSSSPTDAAVVAAIQNLQAQGITVTLKPHVDSLDGIWRGDFTWPSTDTTVAEQQVWLTAWFTSYQSFILHFAKIASDNNVGVMVIGTEFAKLTGSSCAGSCEAYWKQYVIDPLRASYPNLTLAYGANATSAGDEFTSVTFWDDIDIIGVDGYFPLTGHADPTVAQLVSAWTTASGNVNGFAPETALKNLASAHPGKPLIFSEIGYTSTAGTNEAPYNYTPTGAYDPTEQEDCYEAYFEVFSLDTAWMKGVFWWDWSVSAPGANDTGYSPQTKPAGTTTLPEWYGSTTAGFTLAPSNPSMTIGQGLSSSDTISVTPLGGFTGTVTLGTSGLPSGITGVFSAGIVAGTQVLTLTASAGATTGGPVSVTVNGSSGALTAATGIALTVNAAQAQTIAFANPGDQAEGTQLALAATATSGLPVRFASSTASVCTVNNTAATASLLKAGTCTITASQAGNGIYSAATPVQQSFPVTALAPVPVPADADVIVSQINWLDAFKGYVQTSNNPTGGSFAVSTYGELALADTNDLYLINTQTGTETTLGAWSGASAIAIDSKNNIYVGSLYGSPESVIKVPYVGGSSNGGYAAFTTPTSSTPACTAFSTAECTVSAVGAIYPSAMGFDTAGDLFWITSSDGVAGGNGIWECTVACLGGTGSSVQLFQEPTASPAPSPSSGQLIAGGLAIDSSGNIFFTNSSSYVNVSTYAYTSFYSSLNELPASAGVGYAGKTTGYAASPEVLYTITPTTIGAYNNQLDAVAVLRNSTAGDTVYFGDQADGVFGLPDTSGGIPIAAGQPTALYMVSTQGAKTLTLDGTGNLYLAASTTVINSSGADTLAQLKIDNLMLAASPVGTAASTPTYSSSAPMASGQVFAVVNDGVSSPAVSVTASENGTPSAEFSATAGTGSTNALNVGVAFPVTVSYTPTNVGKRSAVLTATDTASAGGSGTATSTGVGQGALVTLDPGVVTTYTSSSFSQPAFVSVDGSGNLFVSDSNSGAGEVFEIAAGSTTPVLLASGFSAPTSTASDANGNLYVADSLNNQIVEIPNVNGVLVPASKTVLVSDAVTFSGTKLSSPYGLAVGPDGVLYISDFSLGSVFTYNLSNGLTGVRVKGLSGPEGIAVDTAGTLYVVNTGSVLVYPVGGAVTTLTLTNVTSPDALAVDPSGSVLVVDQTTGDIVRIPNESGTLITADAVVVESNPTGTTSLALDVAGDLYTINPGGEAVYGFQRTAAALTFATPVDDGSSSSPLTLYVADAGTVALSALATSTPTGPFTEAAGTPACTATLAAGTVCTDSFEFAPTGTVSGTQSGSATVSSNALNAGSAPITLSGTAVGPSFTLSQSAPTLSVAQGSSDTDTITVNAAGGFTGGVTLSASGLPSGVTASFATNPATSTSVLTLKASGTATVGGPVNVAINGISGSLTASTSIALTVVLPPSFTLAPTAASVSVDQGSKATDTINVTPANGFSGNVTLSASGLPSGVTASFATNPANSSSVVTLTASGTATVGGPVTVTVKGTSGALTASATIALTVNSAPSFSLAPVLGTLSVTQGSNSTDTITVTPANGFTGSVTLGASGLPSGVTAAFSPNPATTDSSVLTLTASSTATTGGPVTVTITGTSGTLTETSTVALTVNVPPGFTLSPSPASVTIIQGNTATSTITVTGAGGFTSGVALAASGLPSGVTAAFVPNPATNTSVLTLTATSTATVGGPVTVTIQGTSGALTASTTIALTVSVPPSYTLAANPPTVSVTQGSNATDTITVTGAGGFNSPVGLSASGLPNGVTAAFAPGSAGTQVLTLTASSTAALGGPVTVTINGTTLYPSGPPSCGVPCNLTASTTITLTVNPPPSFTLSPSPASVTIIQGNTATSTITVTGMGGFSERRNAGCLWPAQR